MSAHVLRGNGWGATKYHHGHTTWWLGSGPRGWALVDGQGTLGSTAYVSALVRLAITDLTGLEHSQPSCSDPAKARYPFAAGRARAVLHNALNPQPQGHEPRA